MAGSFVTVSLFVVSCTTLVGIAYAAAKLGAFPAYYAIPSTVSLLTIVFLAFRTFAKSDRPRPAEATLAATLIVFTFLIAVLFLFFGWHTDPPPKGGDDPMPLPKPSKTPIPKPTRSPGAQKPTKNRTAARKAPNARYAGARGPITPSDARARCKKRSYENRR
jgi:hypothetical protein